MSGWSYQPPNPIINFVVGLEFSGPIPSATLKAIALLHNQVRKDLPRKLEQPTFTFQFPGFPNTMQPGRSSLPSQPQIGSVSFDRIKEDGTVSQALATGPNSVTYMTQAYTRWEEYQPISERLVNMVADIAINAVDVTAVLLTAVNKFVWSDRSSQIDLAPLLNPESRYFPHNMLSCGSHSHSFHGYMTEIAEPLGADYIRNININTSIAPDAEIVANVSFTHRVLLKNPLNRDSNLFSSFEGRLSPFREICNLMHDSNNKLFSDVINPNITAEIPGLSL